MVAQPQRKTDNSTVVRPVKFLPEVDTRHGTKEIFPRTSTLPEIETLL